MGVTKHWCFKTGLHKPIGDIITAMTIFSTQYGSISFKRGEDRRRNHFGKYVKMCRWDGKILHASDFIWMEMCSIFLNSVSINVATAMCQFYYTGSTFRCLYVDLSVERFCHCHNICATYSHRNLQMRSKWVQNEGWFWWLLLCENSAMLQLMWHVDKRVSSMQAVAEDVQKKGYKKEQNYTDYDQISQCSCPSSIYIKNIIVFFSFVTKNFV